MSTYPERVRPHEENHIRRLEQQMLDALLRIEELLKPETPETEKAKRGKRST